MGKGDRRTKRGKIANQSFGKFRPKKKDGYKPPVVEVAVEATEEEEKEE